MITYIIKSQDYYKIGKTSNLSMRLKSFDTHCPHFDLVKVINDDVERILHNYFSDKRMKLEWFKLDEIDLSSIDNIAKNKDLIVHNFTENWREEFTSNAQILTPIQIRTNLANCNKVLINLLANYKDSEGKIHLNSLANLTLVTCTGLSTEAIIDCIKFWILEGVLIKIDDSNYETDSIVELNGSTATLTLVYYE